LLKPAVYIIGAGPGDPDLLTVKAVKILAAADTILYADSLVPKEILANVRPDAEIVGTGNKTLEEIVPLMIQRVRENRAVVRLHSGDLTLYSAVREQIQALAEAEIPFQLIPGISTFQAAAAKLNAELTVPGLVQTIILTRISGSASAVPEAEELASLAAHQASLCLYLAARHVEAAQAQLLQYYPADTPVAICFRVGWEDEKIWIVPLQNMAEVSRENNLIRTTMYLVSPALRETQQHWTQERSRLYHPEHSHLFRPNLNIKCRGEWPFAPTNSSSDSINLPPIPVSPQEDIIEDEPDEVLWEFIEPEPEPDLFDPEAIDEPDEILNWFYECEEGKK
jgi:precorrin-4/cobalt-precorrin-4 C11-methyltransferase